MKIKITIKILLFIILGVFLTVVIYTSSVYAYIEEKSEIDDVITYLVDPESDIKKSAYQIQSKDKKNADVVDMETTQLSEFSNVKYIENKNYFLLNPRHVPSNLVDNPTTGTCTTTAIRLPFIWI